MSSRQAKLRDTLEKLYSRYNRFELIKPDPLQFVYIFKEKKDRELAGLFSAIFAYGRVQQIQKSLTSLFELTGPPYEFVTSFNKTKKNKLRTFKHRFNTGSDLADLMQILKIKLDKHGSLENYFLTFYENSDSSILNALSGFSSDIYDTYHQKISHHIPRGFSYLISDPKNKSACKRMNLFLRWMVREDAVDPGLWKSVDRQKLIVPVDIHMARLCKILKLYSRKTVNLNTALEITQSFAKINPEDPVRYDFALSRIGIVENCTGKMTVVCQKCDLKEYCKVKL